MAKFIYHAPDDAADPKGTDNFGVHFPAGKEVEVENPRTIAKLSGHPHFERVDDDESGDSPKRRGRPPKAQSED